MRETSTLKRTKKEKTKERNCNHCLCYVGAAWGVYCEKGGKFRCGKCGKVNKEKIKEVIECKKSGKFCLDDTHFDYV